MKQLLEWLDSQIAQGYEECAVEIYEEVREEVAALIASQEQQYGLRHVDGREVTYPSEEAATAAQQRMRAWPTTKWVKLIRRDYQVGPWETVS